MSQIKNVLGYIYIALILVLITTNIYFITNYKKLSADRDKVLAENATLQASIKNPQIKYVKVIEQGKTTVVTRELIKITTQYVNVVTTVTVPGNGYGSQYGTMPTPWWEAYDLKEDPSNIPTGWELRDGVLYYKETTTTNEPSTITEHNDQSPAIVKITTVAVSIAVPITQPRWNVMGGINTGGVLTLGAGINVKNTSVGISIDTDKRFGIYGIQKIGKEK
jgi:hypothetical protein